MTPDEYCQQQAAASGSSFYYSFLFLPPERRRAIIALYAFCREVDDAVDEAADPGVARAKLDWWRSEIRATFAGEPQHPVARALLPAVRDYDLPESRLMEIIEGMQMDLDYNRYPDFPTLEVRKSRGIEDPIQNIDGIGAFWHKSAEAAGPSPDSALTASAGD